MKLNELKPAPGSKKKPKRVGRGRGSGHGKTSGRGQKGQKARSKVRLGFEGGQMPLQRRVPKRGFTNIFKENFALVNIKDLNRFEPGQEITPELLVEAGLIKPRDEGRVKVLGQGEISQALHVKAHRFSKSARTKIEGAGGRVELVL